MATRRDRRAWTAPEDMALLLRAAMNRGRRRRDGGSIAAWARAHGRTVDAAYTRLRALRADPALRPPEMSGAVRQTNERAPGAEDRTCRAPGIAADAATRRSVEPPQAPAPRGAAGR